jgi:parallel beta-helix repeat protein
VVLALVAAAARAGAADTGCTFYVRAGFVPAGGAADGRSPATALSRIADAAQLINNPGQAVCVGPGVYLEGSLKSPIDGAPSLPVTFRGDPTGASTGDPPGRVVIQPPPPDPVEGTAPVAFALLERKYVTIEGFTIMGFPEAGIQVQSPNQEPLDTAQITVRSNVILGNRTGVLVRSASDILVINNLIYTNTEDGVAVGTGRRRALDVTVLNNTLYENGGMGIRIGDSDAVSSGALVLNNIASGNFVSGIGVAAPSACGYVAGYNLVHGVKPYAPSTPVNAAYDLVADPMFVDPAGADGVVGWALVSGVLVDRSADDDFRLRRRHGEASPAIDAGYAAAAALGIEGVAGEGDTADADAVDLGYHYDAAPSRSAVPPLPEAFMPLYVRRSGDDRNDGKSPQRAKASITAAASLAKAGVVVIVGPGTYGEANIGPASYSGRVTFRADPTGVASGDPAGPVLVDPSLLPPGSSKDTGFLLGQSCSARVEGFHVRFALDAGIQVQEGSDGAVVRDNVVFSSRRGIDIWRSDDVSVINNLAYDNDTGCISVFGRARRPVVRNNTCYLSVDGNGLTLGAANTPVTSARVEYNIFARSGLNGIYARDAYTGRYNVYFENGAGHYGASAERKEGDLVDVDPLFVDPPGEDGRLGGTAYVDDRFELQQLAAGQDENSPAVDLGVVSAKEVDLAGRTTRSDGVGDAGRVDVGYHYPIRPIDTLYVAPDGDDANSGRSADLPLRTVREALRLAEDGVRVRVAAGSYREIDLRPAAGVTVAGAGADATVIDGGGGNSVFDVRAADVTLTGLTVTGAADVGIRGRADRLRVVDCRVIENRERGILLREGSDGLVFNSVVAGNGSSGIVIGSASSGATGVTVAQTTVYGNGGFGLAVGVDSAVASAEAALVNNVVAGNALKGVAFGDRSAPSAQVGYNCNADGYRNLAEPETDLPGDPLLVAPAQGDFHLQQAAAGQVATSSCVDAGWRGAAQLQLGQASTRSDGGADLGRVDVGYHYQMGQFDPGVVPLLRFGDPRGDCDADGVTRVNELVMAVGIALGSQSLAGCPTLDVDGDGRVTIEEVLAAVNALLASN